MKIYKLYKEDLISKKVYNITSKSSCVIEFYPKFNLRFFNTSSVITTAYPLE